MPIYEYRCEDCETVIEKLQKFSDPPLTECARCGGRLQKVISAPGLQFKGSGWYVTDYARSGSNGKNGSEKQSERSSESKSESKSDSKSDTKKSESTTKSEPKAAPSKSD